MTPRHAARRTGRTTPLLVGGLVIGAAAMLGWLAMQRPNDPAELVVYCAAGARPAVEAIAQSYHGETGVHVTLQFGPSGGLETQIRLSDRGDLFLPAAESPYLDRTRADGTVSTVTPLAQQRLVIGLAPRSAAKIGSLAELIDSGLAYGLCNEQAAAGYYARRSLEPLGLWKATAEASTATLPTVTELAEAVRYGGRLEAAIVWDATAIEFGLRSIDVPELSGAIAKISVGVLRSARDRVAAERFVAYLAAIDRGQATFIAHHYAGVGGLAWRDPAE
ncbi:putative binding protein precursor [Botrimarina colliarenosi]|uniref:Putative binding protein n=1 Tax=Botrimarina colliarenosi TaxID=2528001 RepID=A0A5C6AD20_9BACT|nr:substrate-binding domain-containing protein [Botrimarina colliarenosi]TWT97952.1 putative binding protein precursor [Botrimarina colliarenosi]